MTTQNLILILSGDIQKLRKGLIASVTMNDFGKAQKFQSTQLRLLIDAKHDFEPSPPLPLTHVFKKTATTHLLTKNKHSQASLLEILFILMVNDKNFINQIRLVIKTDNRGYGHGFFKGLALQRKRNDN